MKKPAAIITGASSGLGRALSVKLSDEYFVFIVEYLFIIFCFGFGFNCILYKVFNLLSIIIMC